MENESKPLNIYQRINKVMQEVKYVKRDKQVSGGGQNYSAVTHDQVVSIARSSLVANGIVIYPEQLSGEFLVMRDMNAQPQPVKMGLFSGSYIIHFVNIDDPNDRISVPIQAHAQDNGDKAPGKAVTYASKTAVLKVLNLETGENDEAREDAPGSPITGAQIKILTNVFNGDEVAFNEFLIKHGYSSPQQIQKSDYKAAVSAAKIYVGGGK